jgi:uncharacterized protein DUF4235
MAKLLYKPVGAVCSALGGLVAAALFKKLWTMLAGEENAPAAIEARHGWGEILVAAALQGAIFGLVKAAVDRAGATGFERATGTWPGGE